MEVLICDKILSRIKYCRFWSFYKILSSYIDKNIKYCRFWSVIKFYHRSKPTIVYVFIDIWYDILLTAIGLSPGGSITVHIYTQTINRTTQNKQYTEQHNNLGECGPCPVYIKNLAFHTSISYTAFYCNFSMENITFKTACTDGLPDDEHTMFETCRRRQNLIKTLIWNVCICFLRHRTIENIKKRDEIAVMADNTEKTI